MATRIRSDAPVWQVPIAYNWAITGVAKLADEFYAAKQSAENVISAAGSIGQTLSLDVTEAKIKELGRRRLLMLDSTNSIHYEVDELVDNPFARSLSALMEKAYALNPKEITVTAGESPSTSITYSLGMLVPKLASSVDPELRSDFIEKANRLNYDLVPLGMKGIVADALYWQHEYEKTHRIGEIRDALFTDEVRGRWENMESDERLALLNEYAVRIGEVLGDGAGVINAVIADTNLKPETFGKAPMKTDSYDQVYERNGTIKLNTRFTNENMDMFSLDKVIGTVTHEARHQYQAAIVLDARGIVSQQPGVMPVSPPANVPHQLVYDWADRSNYDPDDKTDNSKYWQHPIETDARAFAGLGVA